MSYTEMSMMAEAEKHYRAAITLRDSAEDPGCYEDESPLLRDRAMLELGAGMLAVELAKYAGSP